MKQASIHFLLGVALAGAAPVQSKSPRDTSQFGEFQGDGYYWYKQEPEEEKPKPKPEPKPPVVAPAPAPASKDEPKALSTEWMRANMPKLLEMAVDNPTKENVANYMYAQRVILDKSQRFSEKVKEVVALDPFLDENNRVPIAQFAQPGFLRGVKAGQRDVLGHLATKAGIWVFVDKPTKCSACESYVKDIIVGNDGAKGVASEFNFNFRQIDVSTPAGRAAAKRLELKVTPTTVLVMPPNGFYLVSQGLMSQTQLQDRLLVAAKASGTLPKDLQDKVNPYSKDLLTEEQLDGFAGSGKPSEVMTNLRERIKGVK